MTGSLKNMNARSYIDYGKVIPQIDYGANGGSGDRYPINLFGNLLEIDLPIDKNIRHMILELDSDSYISKIIVNLEVNGIETILEGHFDLLQTNNHYLFGVNQTTFSKYLFISLENDPITHKGMIKAHTLSSLKLRLTNEDTDNDVTLVRIGFIELKDMEE